VCLEGRSEGGRARGGREADPAFLSFQPGQGREGASVESGTEPAKSCVFTWVAGLRCAGWRRDGEAGGRR
jgi:hypothetical protein